MGRFLILLLFVFASLRVLADGLACNFVFEEELSENAIEQRISEARSVVFDPAALVNEYPDIEQTYKSVSKVVPINQPLLSIVIPAYKEARRLPESLVKIQRFFNRYPLPVEILVMVEKSPDLTYEIDSQLVAGDRRIEVVDNKVKNGKGYAVRSGMLRAKGKYILFMDADLSTPLPEIFNFLAELQAKPEIDVLIGDRRSNADVDKQGRSLFRRTLSYGFNKLVQMVSVNNIVDTQCGFKAFTYKAAKEIFKYQTINQFAFDVEVLVLAEQLGYKIATEPVQWIDDDRSTVHPIWGPLTMARDLMRIQWLVRQNLSNIQRASPP